MDKIIKEWERICATGDAPIGKNFGCLVTTELAKNTLETLIRQQSEIKRLQECVGKTAQTVFYAESIKEATNSIVSHDKTKYEELVQELWVLQEKTRELEKDNERLKCYLKEKPNG